MQRAVFRQVSHFLFQIHPSFANPSTLLVVMGRQLPHDIPRLCIQTVMTRWGQFCHHLTVLSPCTHVHARVHPHLLRGVMFGVQKTMPLKSWNVSYVNIRRTQVRHVAVGFSRQYGPACRHCQQHFRRRARAFAGLRLRAAATSHAIYVLKATTRRHTNRQALLLHICAPSSTCGKAF